MMFNNAFDLLNCRSKIVKSTFDHPINEKKYDAHSKWAPTTRIALIPSLLQNTSRSTRYPFEN